MNGEATHRPAVRPTDAGWTLQNAAEPTIPEMAANSS